MVANDALKTISTDGSLADVQAAVNYMVAKAQDGWVITVGAASGVYAWGSGALSVPRFNQAFTITGAGSLATRSKITASGTQQTVISYDVSDNKLARLTNLQFTDTGNHGSAFINIATSFAGATHNSFRVDHCVFTNCNPFAIKISDDDRDLEGIAFGLIDNCTFNANGLNGVYIFAGKLGNQWAGNMSLGTVNAVYVEDCIFNGTAPTVPGRPAIDSAYWGVKWCARHNTFTNWVCVLHGADSTVQNVPPDGFNKPSTLQVEFLHNNLTVDISDYGLYCRGGVQIATDNTFGPSGAFPNQCFKFANDSPSGEEKVGQGAVSGVVTRLGSYFYNNILNGNPLFYPNATSPQFPAGLTLNTDIFEVSPGAGLPLTSYTELVYPHPLQGAALSIPTVTASAATSITTTSATLNGSISSNGSQTITSDGFDWGTTTAYGNSATATTVQSGAFSANITGLTSGQTYHFRSKAVNASGTGVSGDATFVATAVTIPTVTVSAASSITSTTATLNGTISSNGGQTITSDGFDWGTTTAYGNSAAGNTVQSGAFSANITGLASGQTYHFRSKAVNASGTGVSGDNSFVAATSVGTTYYVSFSSGNDASTTPTSTATPWKNCPGMGTYTGSGTLNPGDTVYFNRSDTWSMPASNQGLYTSPGVHYIGNSFGTGTGKAHLQATGQLAAGVVRFRDHPTIETIVEGFEVDANQQDNNGVDINHRFFQVMTGATKRLLNCDVHDSFSAQPNSFHYGIIASSVGGTAGQTANVEIIGCTCFNTSRDAICLYTGDPAAGDTTILMTNCTVRDCEAYNTGQDPNYTAGSGFLVKGIITNAFVEYNYAHNTKGAPYFISSNETTHVAGIGLSNIHLRYNIATTDNNNGGIRIYSQPSGSDPKDLKIYGNIVYNETLTGGLFMDAANASTVNLLIYNNTFYNAELVFQNFTATVQTFEFRNNLCISIGNGVPLTDSGAKILVHTNNVYRAPSGTLVSSGANNFTSANITTYEATALSSDPLFVNTTNLPTVFVGTYGLDLGPAATGLSLQPTSPCINTGFSLASPYNNSINSTVRVSGSWDRGAYERSADTTAPVVSISSPTGGTVTGTITVSATASDNVGVVGVQFQVDGSNLGSEDLVSPYSVSWDTTTASNASHNLTATARDAAGNSTTSASVQVTVSNTSITGHTYSTSFPNTENPISEGSNWIGGLTSGLDWTDCRTTPGLVFGTMPGNATGNAIYADSSAMLAGPWGPDQIAQAKIRVISASGLANVLEEVELRLRMNVSAHSITGYECLISVSTNTNNLYMDVVRWNGALGSFTQLPNSSHTPAVDGDVIKASIVGNPPVITVYLNNVVQFTNTDSDPSRILTGSPGMGLFIENATGLDANYGFSAYSATDGTTTFFPPSPPSNLVATAVSPTSVQLSWTQSTDTSIGQQGLSQSQIRYLIEIQGGIFASFTQLSTIPVGVGTFTDSTSITASTTYSFRIRSSDTANDSSGYALSNSVTTPAAVNTTPVQPTISSVDAATFSTLTVTWPDTTDTGFPSTSLTYNLQRSLTQAGTYSTVPTGATIPNSGGSRNSGVLTFTDTGLSSSTTYWYRVSATNPVPNTSPFSSPLSGLTAISPAAFVQSAVSFNLNPSNLIQVPFTSAQTAGNTNLIVIATSSSSAVTVDTVSDQDGNTYSPLVGPTTIGSLTQWIYAASI